MAELVEQDASLSIDCYRRAFLLSGDLKYCQETRDYLSREVIGERAKRSMQLAASFTNPKLLDVSGLKQAAATKVLADGDGAVKKAQIE